jgi:hypothetical protein
MLIFSDSNYAQTLLEFSFRYYFFVAVGRKWINIEESGECIVDVALSI